MHPIYEALKKAGGKTDGDALIAAAKGLGWDSPRGPMSIDPETRDVVQTSISAAWRRSAMNSSMSSSTRSRTSRIRFKARDEVDARSGRVTRRQARCISPAGERRKSWDAVRAGESSMRKTLVGFAGFAVAIARLRAGRARSRPIKIGVVMSYSGQFADPGAQIDNGIKLYMKEHGDTVAGKKIEIIRKDNGGIAPDVAKRLSQEVIVRDGADILAGL